MIERMIVMAIKPKYAKMIYEDKKHWEFRKAPPPLMQPILLYESAPVGKITGMVTFAFAIKSRARLVWTIAKVGMWGKSGTGITAAELQDYAGGEKGQVSALKVLSCVRFETPIELRSRPPQNWARYEFDFPEQLKTEEVQHG